MKRPFKVTIDVMAYSQEDAQAKVELLLQMGAFCKDFNVNTLLALLLNPSSSQNAERLEKR